MASIYPKLQESMEYVGRGPSNAGKLEINFDQYKYRKDVELEHRWMGVFQEMDYDKDGKVRIRDLRDRLRRADRKLAIPEHIRDDLLRRADMNKDGYYEFHEFLHLIELVDSHAHLDKFHKALALASYVVVPESERPQYVESELKHYTCCPPPIFLILVSAAELAIALYYHFTTPKGMSDMSVTIRKDYLPYNPNRRKEAWRLLSYMLVHAGWYHLIVNLVVQVVLGIPLELVHKYWRVGIVYLLGVIAGALGTSVTDPNVFLVGASGGVYALLAAHLASMIINWKEMEYAWIRLIFWIVLMGSDIGVFIYYRHFYDGKDKPMIGYSAHFCGAICGLLLGVVCLKNLNKLAWERVIWWICLVLTILLFVFAILWNIFWTGFPVQHV
ncbi:rhomboid-related protein 2-like [Paramacrobiotus metropolitanus]|uniref:rhomboid-related protein 2-like n=1 Tax=Paramacrobiotus metropolitanus TaxID=2943436 RepID=UPI002445D51B|nr:rhomboid-related protein 2-like [Paramacrobiotus metropolitanus]